MRIALIGYGEVGRILAEDLRAAAHAVTAFDLKLHSSETREPLCAHALAHGVTLSESHPAAVRNAELVVSAVTARQTMAAAVACSRALPLDSFFLDLNSASPAVKISAAAHLSGGGGRYVEGAVMASISPYRLAVPILLGGPDAAALDPVLRSLGFSARVASAKLGVASATKMCRSVMIKGLEAMLIESLSAARHYGVEDAVIASLQESFPGIDWERQATYSFQRVIEHGWRRTEEMREVAATVEHARLKPRSATATADSQAFIAGLADLGVFGERGDPGFARSPDWRTEADRILARSKSRSKH